MSGVFNITSVCVTPKSRSIKVLEEPKTPSNSCTVSQPTTPPNCLSPPMAHLVNAPKRCGQRTYNRPLNVIPMKSL